MKSMLIKTILEFVATYPEKKGIETRWGAPIVGFAKADDPLFAKLKQVASPAHAVPQDFLDKAQAVIAFFLPFEKAMTRTNIKERNSSREWGVGYIETNIFIIRRRNETVK